MRKNLLLLFFLTLILQGKAKAQYLGLETLPGYYDTIYYGSTESAGYYDFSFQARYTNGLTFTFGYGDPSQNQIIYTSQLINTSPAISTGFSLSDVGVVNSTNSYFLYGTQVLDPNASIYLKVVGDLYSPYSEPPYWGTVYAGMVSYSYYNGQSQGVPAPLPILGVLATLKWSRRIKSRLKVASKEI